MEVKELFPMPPRCHRHMILQFAISEATIQWTLLKCEILVDDLEVDDPMDDLMGEEKHGQVSY